MFVAYTAADLELWADLCARFLVAGGLRAEHTVQIAFGYGLFTGGLGFHYEAEKVGGWCLGLLFIVLWIYYWAIGYR